MSEHCLDRLLSASTLVDTHCHLDSEQFPSEKLGVLYERAERAGLTELWLMSVDAASAQRNLELITSTGAQAEGRGLKLRLAIGIDPELLLPQSEGFVTSWWRLAPSALAELATGKLTDLWTLAASKGVAVDLVGEIGMDYYWLASAQVPTITPAERRQSQQLQEALFRAQLDFAWRRGLPVSIHSRGAESECLAVAESVLAELLAAGIEVPAQKGIFHSFTGSGSQMDEILAAGFCIGVNGIITYKSAAPLLQAVRRRVRSALVEGAVATLTDIYHAGFVLETDAPFLIPTNADRAALRLAYGPNTNDPATVADTLAYILD